MGDDVRVDREYCLSTLASTFVTSTLGDESVESVECRGELAKWQ